MSDAVEIRPANLEDATAIATVQVESWRTTYPGILAPDVIEARTVESRAVAWGRSLRGETKWVPWVGVAERNGEMAGFVSGGPIRVPVARYDAELYAVYLLRSMQGKGIGRRLVLELARVLRERGFQSMVVQVLAANPACRFYERLGATLFNGSKASPRNSIPNRSGSMGSSPVTRGSHWASWELIIAMKRAGQSKGRLTPSSSVTGSVRARPGKGTQPR